MKPLNLHIQGIGPHVDTRVDFTAHKSPLAVCAPMGAGKTSMIEGIFVALYGRGLWYGGSIYEFMTRGGTGKASIEFDFAHGGERYRVERTLSATAKTQTQEARLMQAVSDLPIDQHQTDIAGPKIAEFNRAIRALVGGPETAAATWFCSQNRAGDLAGMPGDSNIRARRREYFHRMLGAEEIENYYQRTVKALADTTSRADEIDAQMEGLPDFTVRVDEHRQQIKLMTIERDGVQCKRNEHGMAQTKILESLAQLNAGDTHHRATIERYEVAHEKAENARKAVADLEAEIARMEALAAKQSGALADLEELGRLKSQREEMRGQVALWDAWRDWSARSESLSKEGTRAVQQEADAQVAMRANQVADEARALSGQIESIEGEYEAARQCNQGAQELNNGHSQRRQQAESALKVAEHQSGEYRRRLDARVDPPFGNDCGPCPYFAEVQSLVGQFAAADRNATAARLTLENIPADEPLTDLEPIIQRGKDARAAAEAVRVAAVSQKHLDEAQTAARAALMAIDVHRTRKPTKPDTDDPQDALEQIQDAIDGMAGAAERLKHAEQAATDLEAKRGELLNAEDSARLAAGSAHLHEPTVECARQALTDQDSERTRLRGAIDAEQAEIDRLSTELTRLGEAIGHHGGQIEFLEGGLRETEAKRQRLQSLRDNAAALEDVKRCFSNQGVRQILIDDAVPDVEVIANRLFMLATDGRQQLRISTQRRSQTGHLFEDFAIMVRDARGEREICGGFSGGELELIRIILRIAVTVWQGNIRGNRPECLIIDEAFDKLGAEFPKLIKVLEDVGSQYEKIIVVTHDQNIADRMPGRIDLQWGIGGTRIMDRTA